MKNSSLKLCAVLSLTVLLGWGCENSTSNENPIPPRVTLVAKSPDTSIVELGIDAEPVDQNQFPLTNKNGIQIHWHPVSDDDLIAYDVFRRKGDTLGSFIKIGEAARTFGSIDTAYLDTTVERQSKFFYYVIARDEADQESDPSTKDWYTVLPEPSLVAPTGGQPFNGIFEWNFAGLGAQHFIFRMERRTVGDEYIPLFLKLYSIEGNVNTNQRWSLDDFGIGALTPGFYRWRVDVVTLRNDREGAESNWGIFVVL